MNWLAHVFLSTREVEHRLGNLLTDTLKPDQLTGYGERFTAGVKCHYEIDRFTDTHEIVKRSKARLFPKYRHYSSVLVDVYYDHLLAVNWDKYCSINYRAFVDQFYQQIPTCEIAFKDEAQSFIDSVLKSDRLGLYGTLDGVDVAFQRIAARRKSSFIDISKSAEDLEEKFADFEEDFLEFFPSLMKNMQKFNVI